MCNSEFNCKRCQSLGIESCEACVLACGNQNFKFFHSKSPQSEVFQMFSHYLLYRKTKEAEWQKLATRFHGIGDSTIILYNNSSNE